MRLKDWKAAAFGWSTHFCGRPRITFNAPKCSVHPEAVMPKKQDVSVGVPRRASHPDIPVAVSRVGKDVPAQNVFKITFSDERHQDAFLHSSEMFELPLLVFVPGLDSRPLPDCQVQALALEYTVVSICHEPHDRSNWDEMVNAITPVLHLLRKRSAQDLTVAGESFGAALALRLAAADSTNIFKRLVLLNPGTAMLNDKLLQSFTALLPLLRIDRTERILYKAAAIFLFKVLLAREDRLAPSSLPEDVAPFLRSVDIDKVPLGAMLHRVTLLKSFDRTFTDDCMRRLVQVPTLLVSSGRDRLLKSRKEVDRLAGLLPNVENKICLQESGHAALLEQDVSLSSLLKMTRGSENTRAAGNSSFPEGNENQFSSAFELGKKVFEPWRKLISPQMFGSDALLSALDASRDGSSQKRPVLVVGNHGVLGILDLSVFFIELTELLGNRPFRSLAHSIHFKQFGDFTDGRWTRFVSDLGAVPASPRNFYKLLSQGENILLFPGGAREVCRRRGEQNKVFWKSGVDFVRPAAKFNAIIVPFSTVGADDSVDILLDGQELQRVPYVGSLVTQLVEDAKLSPEHLMPITSFPPRADRFYFKFHQPIDTANVDHSNIEECRIVYENVRKAVENGIEDLFVKRDSDPKRRIESRFLGGTPSSTTGVDWRSPFDKFVKSILPTFDI